MTWALTSVTREPAVMELGFASTIEPTADGYDGTIVASDTEGRPLGYLDYEVTARPGAWVNFVEVASRPPPSGHYARALLRRLQATCRHRP